MLRVERGERVERVTEEKERDQTMDARRCGRAVLWRRDGRHSTGRRPRAIHPPRSQLQTFLSATLRTALGPSGALMTRYNIIYLLGLQSKFFKRLPQHGHLSLHHLTTRTTNRLSPLYARFKVEDLVDVFGELFVKALVV